MIMVSVKERVLLLPTRVVSHVRNTWRDNGQVWTGHFTRNVPVYRVINLC